TTRAPVETLGIALLARSDIGLHVDLVEALLAGAACALAVGPIGRNEGGDRDHTGIGEEGGNLADAPDILRAILRRKTKVGIEPAADVVAIQHVDTVALLEQTAFDLHGDGGFARA